MILRTHTPESHDLWKYHLTSSHVRSCPYPIHIIRRTPAGALLAFTRAWQAPGKCKWATTIGIWHGKYEVSPRDYIKVYCTTLHYGQWLIRQWVRRGSKQLAAPQVNHIMTSLTSLSSLLAQQAQDNKNSFCSKLLVRRSPFGVWTQEKIQGGHSCCLPTKLLTQ